MSIYQDIILDHYHNPRNKGALPHPQGHITVNNPLCGDILEMSIKVVDNHISQIAFSGQGCAISQAAASILTEYAKGKSIYKLRTIDRDFIMKLLGIELSPNRLKCALLSLEALHALVNQNYG